MTRNNATKLSIFVFLTVLSISTMFSQRKDPLYESYINTYKSVAIKHMEQYKIPASITLAQGLLESGAGQGALTKKSNNHFGIKCHNDWKGETVRAKDDGPNDCFRKYKHAEESFRDHSLFLTEKPRYKSLFSLDITDYMGWAKGLQTAGYATDKAYANKLISLIERYELYLYDKKGKGGSSTKKEEKPTKTQNKGPKYKHSPYITGGLVYIITKEGDNYSAIADEFGFKLKDLLKYNEVPDADFPLQKGDIIYFQKKKKKADKPYYEHIVEIGESMHSISQRYGLRVKNLYKMNKKDMDYIPTEGEVLKLR